jgi:hypothetical protein
VNVAPLLINSPAEQQGRPTTAAGPRPSIRSISEMSPQFTSETLAVVRDALFKAGSAGTLAKAATFMVPSGPTVGLQSYNLEPAAKMLVPYLSPIRNRTPRVKTTGGSQAAWKAVVGVDTGQQYAGVAEGQRGGQIGVTVKDYYAAFRTLGREPSATFEAALTAEGFEDIYALAVSALLQSTMVEEEKILLGGNATNLIGTTPIPSLTASPTGGTIGASVVVSVICVALTFDAFRRFSGATSIVQTVVRQNMDNSTTTINAGTAIPSGNATVTVSAGAVNSVLAKVIPLRGAYGYAWFAGTAGSERFVTVTSMSMTTIAGLPGSGQLASSLAATDYSADSLIHDGLLGMCGIAAYGSYYSAVAAGATLTPDGVGGIVEFDTVLQYFWDNLRLIPTRIMVGSQEMKSLKKVIVAAGVQTSLARFGFNMQLGAIAGGAIAKSYMSCFGDSRDIPIEHHPNMPNGTILFLTETLPYPVSNVGNVFQVLTRQDYWQNDWPVVTRAKTFGVYSDQVLQHYFPPSMGVLTNLSPA